MQEKRKSKRMGIDVKIKLDQIHTKKDISDLRKTSFEVALVNVSLDGIAFMSAEELKLNTFYDAKMILWSKEEFNTVIEIVRMENEGDDMTTYGCRFIGIDQKNQLRIMVHQVIEENKDK